MEEIFDFTTALTNDIVGQRRTGKSKQFVFLHGVYAIKGPYQQGRLTNVYNRSLIFASWGTPCVIRMTDYFNTKDGTFVRFPNIMVGYPLESEPYVESFSTHQYKVLKNPPVLDVGHAITANHWNPSGVEDLILALCHCNILGVGDMNVRNTLIDPVKRVYYIIDFDDNLGTDRNDEYFYFSKAPAKKYNWHERVCYSYNAVATRLGPLLQDPIVIANNLSVRVQRAIDLLHRFAKTGIPPVVQYKQPKTKSSPVMNIPGPVQLAPILPPPVVPKQPEQVQTISIVENTTQSSIGSNSGKMVWKGLRGGATRTFSGIDFDVVKSALQKYIRRNMPEKAILSAIELYRLGEVEGNPGVTNMYNRVAIIANEDIGPANISLVLEVTRIIEKGDRDVARLAAMVQLLSGSSKTRLMSHAWRAYANPEGRAIATKMGVPIDTTFTESDVEYIAKNKNSDLFIITDPENIRPYILIFLKRLYEKDFNAFSWAYFYMETAKEITLGKRKKFINGNPRSSTGKSDILIWKALSKILPPETHDILVEAYYNHTESRPFLQNAILVALYELPYQKLDIESVVDAWRKEPVLQDMLQGKFTLEIDPYVIDKHTRIGRKLGKTIQDFVDEGAVVSPQSETYYSATLESIYKTR